MTVPTLTDVTNQMQDAPDKLKDALYDLPLQKTKSHEVDHYEDYITIKNYGGRDWVVVREEDINPLIALLFRARDMRMEVIAEFYKEQTQ